jgi:hypothetical protein
VQTHSAYAPPACRGSLAGCAPAAIRDANQLLRPATFALLDSALKLALHPCQQAVAFLACTRPPDFFPDFAALFRFLRPCQFFPALTTTVFQLLPSTLTATTRLLPAGDPSQDAARPPQDSGPHAFGGPHHLQGFLVTSLGGLLPFHGLFAHSLIFGSVQRLYASYIYVLCLPAPPPFFLMHFLLTYFSFLLICTPIYVVVSIWSGY